MSYYLEVHNSTEHDGSIALDDDGKITIYSSERIDRKKHSCNFVALKDYFTNKTNGYYDLPRKELIYKPFQEIHHHLAHACSSFFSSPFDKATILVLDGMGPYKNNTYASTSIWQGEGNNIKLISINPEKYFSYNSLGHLYSAVTYYCGFDFWQEGKTMGLASYGSPSDISIALNKMVTLLPSGGYAINQDFIGYCFSLKYPQENIFRKYYAQATDFRVRYEKLIGLTRNKDENIQKSHENLSWAVQNLLEKIIFHLIDHLKNLNYSNNLCISGGLGLNSVVNAKILHSAIFENIYIPPVCGDDGQALGKLLYKKYFIDKKPRSWSMTNAYLGPEYEISDIKAALKFYNKGIIYKSYRRNELLKIVAKNLVQGKIIGWFQGRSEIGSRALGHRSILADPREAKMKNIINDRIKHREMFRPFAPSILEEYLNDYFYLAVPSPFMLYVFRAKQKAIKSIPAVVHVDGTSRVQSVNKLDNGIYYDLIQEFYKLTKVPVLLNTSFNDSGEPIVETPTDAIKAFINQNLDLLVMENYIVYKKCKYVSS